MIELGRVAVVGGGIAGMAAALSLSRIGARVEVFERAQTFGTEGIFLSVFPNGLRFLAALDPSIVTELEAQGIDQRVATVRASDGTLIAERAIDYRERFGLPLLGLRWSALHEAMRQRLPNLPVHMSQQCVAATLQDEDVTLLFGDGSERRFDLVVAADGVSSKLRAIFRDDAPTYAGRISCRALTMPPEGTRLEGVSMDRTTGHTFATGPLGDGRVFWNAMLNAPADTFSRDPAAAKCTLLTAYAGFHSWARQLIEATPSEMLTLRPILVREPLETLSRGRLVIVGDAAHAMQISTGQGANLAIEEGVDLALCLREASSLEAARREFDKRRVERAQLVHARNLLLSNAAHSAEGQAMMKALLDRARMDELEFQHFLHSYEPSGTLWLS